MSIDDEWRDEFVQRLCGELVYFEQQHPDLVFSVIYPMRIWSRRTATSPAIHRGSDCNEAQQTLHQTEPLRPSSTSNDFVSAIWCHLRVSEGSIVTSEREPIYDSTQWNMRRESESLSRITGITSTFSLQIEDHRQLNGQSKGGGTKQNENGKALSKKGNVQTGRFPVIAKKMGYKQLT